MILKAVFDLGPFPEDTLALIIPLELSPPLLQSRNAESLNERIIDSEAINGIIILND